MYYRESPGGCILLVRSSARTSTSMRSLSRLQRSSWARVATPTRCMRRCAMSWLARGAALAERDFTDLTPEALAELRAPRAG